MSGYCPVCKRLLPIEQRGMRNTRQAEWFTVEHPAANDDTGGRVCPGVRKAI